MTATDTATSSKQGEPSPAAETKIVPDPDEQEKIDKAIKFWSHPSLHNVSSEEKRAFLHGQGLNDAQIHRAWEKMISDESDSVVGGTAKQARQGGLSPQTAAAVPNAMHSNGATNQQQRYSQQEQQSLPYGSYPQHPYQQSSHHYPYSSMEDEEDGTISVAKGVSLVAVGGFLGLTAAAAVRWLNGGDFQLLPPPVDGSSSLPLQQDTTQQQQQNEEDQDGEYYDGVDYAENEGHDYEYAEEDEEYVDTLEVQQRLFEKMEELSQTVATNTAAQEQLMVKISSSASTVTNQSMNLLRTSKSSKAQNDLDVSSLSQLLTEVKDDLSAFTKGAAGTANGNRQELQEESAKLGEKLEKCLDMLKDAAETSEGDKDLFASHTKSPSQCSPESSPSLPTETPRKSPQSEITPQPSSLHDFIRQIAEGNDASALKVGTQLLYLYLVNLSGKPENARYRKIYTSNQSFQKVESLVGGKELLQAVGFVADEDKSLLEWIPSGDAAEETAALVRVKEAASALSILKSGKPGAELTELALSKLTPLQDVFLDATDEESAEVDVNQAVVSPPPPSTVDEAPQTPAGSMLVSPPMTKKLPFPEQASATPTNLSDRLDKLPIDEGDEK